MEVHRSELSGIPAVWVPSSGPTTGGLMFRVGMIDEPLMWRGMSHAVEHLGLHGFDQYEIEHNGMTTPITTAFYATGDPARVARFLEVVAMNLQQLPENRVESELRVLRAEAARHGSSPFGDHLHVRFGNAGPGVVSARELAPYWAGIHEVQTWSTSHFNSANACLFYCGERPSQLQLRLPDGIPLELQRPTPRDLTDPIWMGQPGTMVAVSWLAAHSPATDAVLSVIERLATERLREEAALSYQVGTTIERISPDLVQVGLFADAAPGQTLELQEAMLLFLSELGLRGCRQADIDAAVQQRLTRLTDERAAPGRAIAAAHDVLMDRPTMTETEIAEVMRIVTPALVRDQIEAARPKMIWTVNDVPRHSRWEPFRVAHDDEVSGTTFVRSVADVPPDGEMPTGHIVAGREGLTLHDTAGSTKITIRWTDVEAVLTVAEDIRVIESRDGSTIGVAAAAWQDGRALIQLIEQQVPKALRVDISA